MVAEKFCMVAKLVLASLVGALLSACMTPKPGVYVGGVRQPEGLVALSERTYAFRFSEKWRISHRWVQGTGVAPCKYWNNIFHTAVNGFPKISSETEAPMFAQSGTIYVANVLPRAPLNVYFFNAGNRIQGEMPNGFQRTGYTPFCSQAFLPASPNGIALWLVKPDPAKGTDEWIRDAQKVTVNGRTWLVSRRSAQGNVADTVPAADIELWTLKIPDTPYWMHLRFTGNQRSVTFFAAEHTRLLGLFHQVIESIHLEPITTISPTDMPPFVDRDGQLIK